MINTEVIPAFDMLLDELEAIIPELNKKGAQLMQELNYAQAKDVIAKAEAVMAFKEKVKALRDEWLSLDVPSMKPPKVRQSRAMNKKHSRNKTSQLKSGLRTKNEDFHLPILRVLIRTGGHASLASLLTELEKDLASQLNEYDWETLPSSNKTVRWKNNVGWAKKKLIDSGYLSGDSPKGTWEITEAGRMFVEKQDQMETILNV